MIEKDSQKIGNVIRIIDERTLIINVGCWELSVGDEIKVYESLDTLYDIDGSELCILEYTKDILEVIEIEDKYSICQKQKIKTNNLAQIAISPLLTMQQSEYIPLNINKEEIAPLKPKDPVIHVGDPVKKAWHLNKIMVRLDKQKWSLLKWLALSLLPRVRGILLYGK